MLWRKEQSLYFNQKQYMEVLLSRKINSVKYDSRQFNCVLREQNVFFFSLFNSTFSGQLTINHPCFRF